MSKELLEKFQFALESIIVIESRFRKIKSTDDFIGSEEGDILLDAIAMRLQAIGENVKSISKSHPEILDLYPDVDWRNIIRFRDIISHHYEGLDYEIVFNVCSEKIPELKKSF
ncbi:toxin-antitoxin system antitoxin subunit [Leptospira wolffii]|uniref:Toxin-antitoxin system antitoxin subunit n=1 Tax=Leptospira wolffii TaxID=409998 RepID=A0A2M9Z8Z6_9LEPT|nr:HepT-like ribonuclease domain-containing protein [Leptospira wolffii]PJZ64864.1 toxin-antitoxin system antitoxin subunit [Leptospira wolffii]